MSEIKALLFDVFGTVVDWRTGIASSARDILRKYNKDIDFFEFADAWRIRYQPAMEEVRSGKRDFTILDILHHENLQEIKKIYGLTEMSIDDDHNLVKAWHRLPGWPDSSNGLKRLKKKFIIATQSNGNIALIVNMAKNSDLPWDMVLGAEVVKHYKPKPEAYTVACQMLGLKPNQCMMVAAHNSDLEAARIQGMRTAFVKRETEHGVNQSSDLKSESNWDYISNSFIDLADQLNCPKAT